MNYSSNDAGTPIHTVVMVQDWQPFKSSRDSRVGTSVMIIKFFRFGFSIAQRQWLLMLLLFGCGNLSCEFVGGLSGVQAPSEPKVASKSQGDPRQDDDDSDENESKKESHSPGGKTSSGPNPEILCKFKVACGVERMDLNIECKGESSQQLDAPMPSDGCAKIKSSLDERGLPTGKTQATLQGGSRASVTCEDKKGRLTSTAQASSGTSTLLFFVPNVVCNEFRDIINSFNI